MYVASKSDRTPFFHVGTVFSNDKSLNQYFGEDINSSGVLDGDEFESIFFTNDTTGYVGGSLGTIYKMDTKPNDIYGNYGWELKHQSVRDTKINEIAFYSDEIGVYIQSDGADAIDSYMAFTIDEGVTWTEGSQIDLFDVEGVSFPGLNTVYVVGSGGQIFLGNFIYEDDETGLFGKVEKNDVKLFPNPVADNCFMELPDNIQFSKLKVVNSRGEEQVVDYEYLDGQVKLRNLAQLNVGVYCIQVIGVDDKVLASSKLVKE